MSTHTVEHHVRQLRAIVAALEALPEEAVVLAAESRWDGPAIQLAEEGVSPPWRAAFRPDGDWMPAPGGLGLEGRAQRLDGPVTLRFYEFRQRQSLPVTR